MSNSQSDMAHSGQSHEHDCASQTEKRARSRRRILRILLPLLATVAVVLAVPALREALWGANPSRPTPQQLRAALETALDQVYRSFELDDESEIYDWIAQSVSGDAIRDVYLEVRRSLLDDDGGRVSIEDVRVENVDGIRWLSDGGCHVDATWFVRGTVGHFGHEHERRNRYRALLVLCSEAGAWKLGSIQITEQEREN